jgi:uncharacterized membrane protein YjgN (DUF898 family)
MENVMSTGVESWSAESFAEMSAMSPFVGTEVILTVVVVVIWIVWQIWQIKAENAGYDELEAKL